MDRTPTNPTSKRKRDQQQLETHHLPFGASQQGPVLGGYHGRSHGGLVTIFCARTTTS